MAFCFPKAFGGVSGDVGGHWLPFLFASDIGLPLSVGRPEVRPTSSFANDSANEWNDKGKLVFICISECSLSYLKIILFYEYHGIKIKGGRSYKTLQYQPTKTPVPDSLHQKGYCSLTLLVCSRGYFPTNTIEAANGISVPLAASNCYWNRNLSYITTFHRCHPRFFLLNWMFQDPDSSGKGSSPLKREPMYLSPCPF